MTLAFTICVICKFSSTRCKRSRIKNMKYDTWEVFGWQQWSRMQKNYSRSIFIVPSSIQQECNITTSSFAFHDLWPKRDYHSSFNSVRPKRDTQTKISNQCWNNKMVLNVWAITASFYLKVLVVPLRPKCSISVFSEFLVAFIGALRIEPPFDVRERSIPPHLFIC